MPSRLRTRRLRLVSLGPASVDSACGRVRRRSGRRGLRLWPCGRDRRFGGGAVFVGLRRAVAPLQRPDGRRLRRPVRRDRARSDGILLPGLLTFRFVPGGLLLGLFSRLLLLRLLRRGFFGGRLFGRESLFFGPLLRQMLGEASHALLFCAPVLDFGVAAIEEPLPLEPAVEEGALADVGFETRDAIGFTGDRLGRKPGREPRD